MLYFVVPDVNRVASIFLDLTEARDTRLVNVLTGVAPIGIVGIRIVLVCCPLRPRVRPSLGNF
jgi:hypothetical protein